MQKKENATKKDDISNQLEFAESILRNEPAKSCEIANRILDNIDEDSIFIDRVMEVEAKALWYLGKYEEAVDISSRLIERSSKNDNHRVCGIANNIKGNVFYDLGNREKALSHYMNGLTFSKKALDKKTEGLLLNNIGEIYKSYSAYDKALKYYLLSLDIAELIEDDSSRGIVQINIGELYFLRGNNEVSLRHGKLALEISIENEDLSTIAYAHLLFGRIFKSEKQYKKAYEELNLAIDIFHKVKDRLTLLLTYEILIELLIDEEKFEEALDISEDAFDIVDDLNIGEYVSKIAFLTAKIYDETGDFRKSLDYYKMYMKEKLIFETEKHKEQEKYITAQIAIEKATHEKEIFRLKNIELRKKSDEIIKMYEDVSVINAIGQDITSTLDIKQVLYFLYKNVNRLMDASYFGVVLYDSFSGKIESDLVLQDGEPSKFKSLTIDDRNSICAWSIRHEEAIISNDYQNEYEKFKRDKSKNQLDTHQTRSLIYVPLIIKGEIIGIVTVQSESLNAYSEYNFNMIKALASYIAIAIKNSKESENLAKEIEERRKYQIELEAVNEKLSQMSYIDALTKIPNRRSFVDYLEREFARAKRNAEELVVLIIDIDFFKEYNDNYGHVEGDKCIAQVASILKKTLRREIDFVARYGGDEFVAVLTNTEYVAARKMAEKFVSNLKKNNIEHKYSKITDLLTITIGGICHTPTDEDSIEKIIHLADSALYVAKDRGRNQFCFFNELEEYETKKEAKS